MKKILLVFVFLLNLLPIVTNNHIMMGLQGAKAQSMGSENVTYYQCENDNGDMYFSMTPCPESQLPDVCITACKYCHNSMDCDILIFHHCNQMPKEEDKSEWEVTPDNPKDNPSTGGGGGGSSNNNGSSSSQEKDWDKRPDWKYYDPETCDCCNHNIPRTAFTNDLAKATVNITQNNSTCSAACIEKCLAELKPEVFKKLAWDLYKQGESEIGGLKLPSCFRDYTTSELSKTDFGGHYADMLIQSALINKMNFILSYDPVKDTKDSDFFDKKIGQIEGMQLSDKLYDMLKSLGFEDVTFHVINQTLDELHNIDFTNYFVIALCSCNDNDYNLNGNIWHMHYAQILGIDDSAISYWSWQAEHSSLKEKTDNFVNYIKIKK